MGIEKGTLTNSSPFLPGTIPGNKETIHLSRKKVNYRK